MMNSTFLVSMLICVTVSLILFFFAGRYIAAVTKTVGNFSEEKKNEIMNQTYKKENGKDLYSSYVYVAAVKNADDRRTALIVYYSGPNYGFQQKKVVLRKGCTGTEEIREDSYASALMKYNRQYGYYEFRKLL